ncbi:MAG: response regulator, partial [Proteobacteria bacterium]|nr:response regulator [Pseudomonadota bacterium]
MNSPSRVLIVDDDPVMRALLQKLISSSPEFIVVGTAVDAFDGRDKIVQLNPDLMTLDIEMPRLDGVTFLRKVMAHHPIPTLIISSLAHGGSTAALAALEAGAADAMPKPVADRPGAIDAFKADLLSRLQGVVLRRGQRPTIVENPAAARVLPAIPQRVLDQAIVAIGASTGGTEAIRILLESLRPPFPPIVIVQHMPPVFTKVFAANLAKSVPFDVIEGQSGDALKPNRVIIAPGDFHM